MSIINYQSRYLHYVILSLILCAAAFLRLYGSPLYHPDEHLVVVQAHYMPQRCFKPEVFNYPSFYSTFLAIIYKFLPFMGKGIINKMFYPADTLAALPFYQLQARFVTAMLGTLTVLLVYLIGRALAAPSMGLASAALIAIAFNHVENSHYATVDVPMTFNATAAFLFSCLYFRSGRIPWAILGGLWCGLTIGTKYNGFLIIIPFFLALSCVAARGGLRNSLAGSVLGIAAIPFGFLLACPYFIPMSSQYINEIRVQMKIYRDGFPGYDDTVGPNNWVWNAVYLWKAGIGALPMILALSGCVAIILTQGTRGWLLACFPLCYYAYISYQSVRITRNLDVLIPFLSLLGGYALWQLCEHVCHRFQGHKFAGCLITMLIVIAVLSQPLSLSLGYARMMKHTDPRTLAIAWAESNIPRNNKIHVEFLYGPMFPQSRYSITNDEFGTRPLAWYLERSYDYIVTSSGHFMHWNPKTRPEWIDTYNDLERCFEEVASFQGNELGLSQAYYAVSMRPTIKIYDLHKPR